MFLEQLKSFLFWERKCQRQLIQSSSVYLVGVVCFGLVMERLEPYVRSRGVIKIPISFTQFYRFVSFEAAGQKLSHLVPVEVRNVLFV